MPEFRTPEMGKFGAGKGRARIIQYHPARDLHIANRETEVNLYAAHEGWMSVARDAPKYRHYLSIRKDIKDDNGNVLGKMVTLYGHIDLNLDSADNILLDGKWTYGFWNPEAGFGYANPENHLSLSNFPT